MNWRKPLIIFLDDFVYRRGIHQQAHESYNYYKQSLNRQIQIQKQLLSRLLKHAESRVPYYRETLTKYGVIDANNHIHMENFSAIPLLTKDILRERFDDLKSEDLNKRKWHLNASGGSTGEPVSFIQDATYDRYNKGSWLFFNQIIGLQPGDLLITLWGSDRDLFENSIGVKKKIANKLRNHQILGCSVMSSHDMSRYVEIIMKQNPRVVHGYADPLYELAKYINANRLVIPCVEAVISAASTLHPFMRGEIQEAFSCPVYNHYGSREMGGIASEWDIQGPLKVYTYTHFVEILDKNGKPCPSGVEGELVVTSLHNFAMPLIRYRMSDLAITENAITTDQTVSVTEIKQITGRTMQAFIKKDGSIVSPVFFHFLGLTHNFKWIKKAQFIQEDYNRILIKLVVVEQPLPRAFDTITESVRKLMGQDCIITYQIVDDILPTSSGKYQYVKSLVTRQ